MSGNGAETTRLSGVLRFLGLADTQRRGAQESRASAPQPPSEDDLHRLALARLLQNDADGATVLLRLLEARIRDAMTGAHEHVVTHALCAGFLGAHAALTRLHDDLTRLRG